MGATNNTRIMDLLLTPEQKAAEASKREYAWANRDDASGRQERLLASQKAQKSLEDAQKKNADELSMALKFQKQFAAKAQGKNGTLLTNPGTSGAAPVPAPGQKTLIGQ